ncbi:hypothetical protein CY34DRAFT_17360 [Suillus luteus UH-Slu-Lm8-n1]|uniref:Uncharacterized protein n=1 Tax=Suillus luteus UH-Slu-Lm8-n1 TaxID=930992 RepID=A0A0D0AA14_9AGAM|nr:hypothetical protein CY34DRAFT_17360 [Suillus luteus UH-Slu-Lm8-n1]
MSNSTLKRRTSHDLMPPRDGKRMRCCSPSTDSTTTRDKIFYTPAYHTPEPQTFRQACDEDLYRQIANLKQDVKWLEECSARMGDDHLARLCALQAQVNEMNAEMCAMEAQHAEEVATYQDKIEGLQEAIRYQDNMLAYRTEEVDRLEVKQNNDI